jgi:hypothetical protein
MLLADAAPSSSSDGGMPVWAFILIGVGVALLLVFVFLVVRARKGSTPAVSARTCGNCKRAMLPQWDKCMFCGWKPPIGVAQVEFICGPLSGQIVSLAGDVTTIGSIGGNNVVLADPAVSRKHVGIRKDGDGYELADLGSTNGVYVNGQRTAKKKLVPGDIIRIGTSEMVFKLQGKMG